MDLRSLKPVLARYVPVRLLEEVRIEVEGAANHLASKLLPRRAMSLRRARELRGLRLIIGGGDSRPDDGWHTVDFRATADFQVDIRRGLPFGDASCRFIFSEHVFEHLDMQELRRVTSECYRVLEPGGMIRIVTPDLEKWAQAYVTKNSAFFEAIWGHVVPPATGMNHVFYVPTHRFIHDFESLSSELRSCGFDPVFRSAWRESRFPDLNLDAEWEHRRVESMYVEAMKPHEPPKQSVGK